MSLFPNSVYSSPGVLQGDLNNFASPGPMLQYTADIPSILVVSTLIASSTIQTSTLKTTEIITNELTASTITLANGGQIAGVSSIVASGGVLNFNNSILANIGNVIFASNNGRMTGLSTITASNNILSLPVAVSGVTDLGVSTINTNQVARTSAIAQFASQTQSTFNTNSLPENGPPVFPLLNQTLSTGHTYQMSYTGQVAMVGPGIPGSPPPTGDSFSWSFQSGATNIKLYQVPATEVYYQSAGPLSSIRESVTTVFTAGAGASILLGSYQVASGTNYQYPSTTVSFTGPLTLLDLGVPKSSV